MVRLRSPGSTHVTHDVIALNSAGRRVPNAPMGKSPTRHQRPWLTVMHAGAQDRIGPAPSASCSLSYRAQASNVLVVQLRGSTPPGSPPPSPPSSSRISLHRLLGLASSSTSAEIKRAYLRRVKQLHPDTNGGAGPPQAFLELQSAWERYQNSVGADLSHGNFTTFGVGCSFADSEEERAERQRVMEAAALGGFEKLNPALPSDDRQTNGDSSASSRTAMTSRKRESST